MSRDPGLWGPKRSGAGSGVTLQTHATGFDCIDCRAQARAGNQSAAAPTSTLLRREDATTLEGTIATTGWRPHTTRAVLTSPCRKARVTERGKRDDVSIGGLTGEA